MLRFSLSCSTARRATSSLRLAGLAAGLALLASAAGCATAPTPAPAAATERGVAPAALERPEAVVFVIADGLGSSQITFARDLAQGRGVPGDSSLERFRFELLPVRGVVSTHSVSNWVTDSAAAATAMASGVKTDNARVGQRPDGSDVVTLADRALERGWRVGYVTNTEVTHATPAGFYASVPDRYTHVDTIAEQLLEQGPHLALGGGRSAFLPLRRFGSRQDDRDLLAEAEAAGYTVWDFSSDRDAPVATDKLLGLFGGGHLQFVLDRESTVATQRTPTLAELTDVALGRLGPRGDGDDTGFLLVLEAGRIDHAAHDFDAAGVAAQVRELDDAMAVVLEYQRQHPGTLVLLTADHATGGLAINDYVAWDTFDGQRASLSWIVADVQDLEDPEDLAYLREMTGMEELTAEDLAAIQGISDKYAGRRILGTRLADRNGVTWLPRIDPWETKGHTGEDVPLYAGGPGSDRFGGSLDNVEIPERLAELLGWGPLNP